MESQGHKVREAIFLYRVTEIAAPGICVHCTTILEGTVHGFIFDIDGKSTQLIPIRSGHFHYVYMGGGSSYERHDTRVGRGEGAELAFVTKRQNTPMLEWGNGIEREWSHG